MPFPVPTVAESTARQLRDIENALPNEDVDTGTDSDYGVRAAAISAVADGLYAYQGWIVRQIFADTADKEYLELHARTRSIIRKKATNSVGTAEIKGTPGKTLSAGAQIKVGNISITTIADVAITQSGTSLVQVRSDATGAAANTSEKLTGILVSPPEGINSTVTVNPLSGGTDPEDDSSLLARYLDILRKPPAGGNKSDYKRWALEVDGVTSAYVQPLRRGLGTVDIAITSNNDIPPQELIDSVTAHIEEVRPVTAKNTLVLAPTKKTVDFYLLVRISGITLNEAKEKISAEITDFMNRLVPGQELILSQLEAQISLISGIQDRKIISPSENVVATIDSSTWEWLRAGNIDIQPLTTDKS